MLMSTSTEGSVNGKNEGRNRTVTSAPRYACANSRSVVFSWAMVTSVPTISPSIWWNMQ